MAPVHGINPRRSVQIAGCLALRSLVQLQRLQGETVEAAVASLRNACQHHANDPDVETPAMHALGLLGMDG